MPFRDVRGHEMVVTHLQTFLSSQRIATAYLFAGPEGIGKSRLVRQFLAALLCSAVDGPDSCGTCPTCRRIAQDTHPDVHCLTVQSGRKLISIDQIRELQKRLVLVPLEGAWKAAVIDAAELLTVQAQNSFLRTLEEPPGQAVICVVAPAARSLLPTIVSRCQVLTCRPLSEEDSLAVIRDLMDEGAEMGEEDARILGRLAGGSPGRALHMAASPVMQHRRELLNWLSALENESPSMADRLGRIVAESEALTKGERAVPVDDVLWLYGHWARDLVRAAWGRPVANTDYAQEIGRTAERLGPAECVRRLAAVEAARHAHMARNLNPRLILESALLTLTGGAGEGAPMQEHML